MIALFLRKLRPRKSLALRIAFASAVFGLVLATGAIALGYEGLSHQLDERSAAEMQGRRELLEHILATIPAVPAIAGSEGRFADLFFGHDDLHLALEDPHSGKVLLRSSDIAAQSMSAPGHAAAAADAVHGWLTPGGGRFTGLHGTAKVADGGDVRFFLSVDRHRDASLLAGFLEATILAVPLLLFMVATGAGLIASTSLAPLRNFNRLAESISAKSLNQRLSLVGLPRELTDTGREINGMLERIDAGYRQLEDFSGDLAHEMRTPVATLLGRTQVALSQSRSTGELREVLEGNVEELNRLASIISDMLFIAQAEHYAVPVEAGLVDLSHEAQTVADYMSLIAEEKDVRLEVNGEAPAISADRLLIQRVITNLVSNAIRHASAHSVVSIEVASLGANTSLAVTNSGEPIVPANLQRIFDRFYRVDPARARAEGGSGLGLAIVRSIAMAHHGSVAGRSEGGRTTFTLSFPTLPRTASSSCRHAFGSGHPM